ncbi:hypothetical protein [Sulfuriferula sp. AH1]|uniref:hypothetical protein n=1 Tax=Sulfuriferula sp. AH1 TaxID=1985873 RepID=UPI001671E28A|nr:hypothetical protein [Sulfuriferula sp. AH1]
MIKIRTYIKPGNLTFGKAILSDQVGTTTFDPMHYGLILAALLVAGILHWLVGSVSISVSNTPAIQDGRITTEKSP